MVSKRFQIINLNLNSPSINKFGEENIAQHERQPSISLGKWTNIYFDKKHKNRSIYSIPKKCNEEILSKQSNIFRRGKTQIQIKSGNPNLIDSKDSNSSFNQNVHHSERINLDNSFPHFQFKVNKFKQNNLKKKFNKNYLSKSFIVNRVFHSMIEWKNFSSNLTSKRNLGKIEIRRVPRIINLNCIHHIENGIRRNANIKKFHQIAFQTMKQRISKYQLDIPIIPRILFKSAQNKSIENREIKISKGILKINSQSNWNPFKNRYILINFLKTPEIGRAHV